MAFPSFLCQFYLNWCHPLRLSPVLTLISNLTLPLEHMRGSLVYDHIEPTPTSGPLHCCSFYLAHSAWPVPSFPSDICCNVSFSGSLSLSVTTQNLNLFILYYFPSLYLLLDLELYNSLLVYFQPLSFQMPGTKNNAGYLPEAQYIHIMNETMAYIYLTLTSCDTCSFVPF